MVTDRNRLQLQVVEMCFIIKVCRIQCGSACMEEQARGTGKRFQPDGGLQGPDDWYSYLNSEHLIMVELVRI